MDEIEEKAIKKAEEKVYLITENLGDLEKKEAYDIMLKFVKYGIRLMREEIEINNNSI